MDSPRPWLQSTRPSKSSPEVPEEISPGRKAARSSAAAQKLRVLKGGSDKEQWGCQPLSGTSLLLGAPAPTIKEISLAPLQS